MSNPETRDLGWLKRLSPEVSAMLATASVRSRVFAAVPLRSVTSLLTIPAGVENIVVAGGGALMDEAKFWRARSRPEVKLILVPTIWGSGAEVSEIVVLNRQAGKEILKGPEFLPNSVVYWPELLSSVSPQQAQRACGDVWAHTLEAFLSPLANDELRVQLAALIRELLELPLVADVRWLTASARACRLQAQASVGLIHGIAHVLEEPCRSLGSTGEWGHAGLCSIFLLPVMKINRSASTRWDDLLHRYPIDESRLWRVLQVLYDPQKCSEALPVLRANWARILRDPCTRTNGVLIRPRHLEEIECQIAA